MKLQPLMSLHTRGFVVMSWAKLWSVHVSDAAQWAVNDGSRSRKWPLSHLEAAVRYYTHVTVSSPPHPVQCEHVGLMRFFSLQLGPEEAAAGPLLSRVESSRRRCKGRCSRRERWGAAEPLTAACSCGSLLAAPAAPYLEKKRPKEKQKAQSRL